MRLAGVGTKWVIAGAVGTALIVGCAGSPSSAGPTTSGPVVTPTAGPPKAVKLTLNFLAGGPQMGFMYAKKLGYYKDVGLDVTIEEGQGSGSTAQLIGTAKTDIGFADAPAIMSVRSKGGAIKIIAPILQTNGFAIMSLKESNLTKVKDLVGKKVAVQAGTAQTALLDAVFLANGMDKSQVNIVNIDPSALVGSLLQKQVDAILGGADFQGVQLADRGTQINVLYYKDIGVPTVGLSLAANEDLIKKDPDMIAKFVAASLKGWDAARKDPKAGAQAILEQFPAAGTVEQFQKQAEIDFKVLCGPGAKSLGLVPTENWAKTYDLLTKYQGLPTAQPITDYYTEQFLPKNGPGC